MNSLSNINRLFKNQTRNNSLSSLINYNNNYSRTSSSLNNHIFKYNNSITPSSPSYSIRSYSSKKKSSKIYNETKTNNEIRQLDEDEKKLDELEERLKNMPKVSIGSMLKQVGFLLALALRGHMSMHVTRLKYREFYNHVLELLESKKDVIEMIAGGQSFDIKKVDLKNFVVFERNSPLARAMRSNKPVDQIDFDSAEDDDDDYSSIGVGSKSSKFEPIVITMTLFKATNENGMCSVDAVVIGKAIDTAVDGNSTWFNRMIPRSLPLVGNLNSKASLQSLSLLIENEMTGQQQEFPLIQAADNIENQTTTTSTTFHTEQDEITVIQETVSMNDNNSKNNKNNNNQSFTTIELDDYNEKPTEPNNNTNKKYK